MQKCHPGKVTAASSLQRVDWLVVCIHTHTVLTVPICAHCFHAHTPAGRTQDSETHPRATDPLPCLEPISSCSVYSCMLIMMTLNDDVGLNNDSQLKALNMAPCSRANGAFVSYRNTCCPLSLVYGFVKCYGN